ncbi:carbon-nitrogen family hydrolase [Cytobacillus suaedae]|nr:carbon-nitrogen family hydrolase [Cytobacillus suaedae]
MQLKIACIQLDIIYGNPEKNKQNAEFEISKVFAESEPDVIVLPELWTTGYDLTRLEDIADHHGEDTIQFIGNLSKKFKVNIVAGSVAKKTDEGVKNTMFIFNRNGEVVGEYSKLHLFKLMDEHHYLIPGDVKGLFSIEGIPSSGVICYDIRFPEWIRAHTTQGAEVVFVVAEWPLPRLEHWRALLISRAIENQCYVVACNRAGSDPANVFAGHSMIIDPWGEIIAEASTEPETLMASIDLEQVKKVRKQIPIFQDRRPNFYQ